MNKIITAIVTALFFVHALHGEESVNEIETPEVKNEIHQSYGYYPGVPPISLHSLIELT